MQNLSLFQSFRLRTFLSTKRSLQYFGTHMSGPFRKLNVFLVKEAMFYSADRWKIEIPINSNVLYSLFKDYINLYSFLSCACVYLCVFLPFNRKSFFRLQQMDILEGKDKQSLCQGHYPRYFYKVLSTSIIHLQKRNSSLPITRKKRTSYMHW